MKKKLVMGFMALSLSCAVMGADTTEVQAAKDGLNMVGDEWYYMSNGEIDKSKNGFIEYDGGLFFVSQGRLITEKSGLVQDPINREDWYYLSKGQAQTKYTGLAQYDGAWFYVENGKLNTKLSDFVSYDGGLFYVGAGRIMKEVNGLAQDPNGSDWYYLAGGQAQTQYTGLAQYDGAWFYVIDGRLALDYTGWVSYDGSEFYVVSGMVQTESDGLGDGNQKPSEEDTSKEDVTEENLSEEAENTEKEEIVDEQKPSEEQNKPQEEDTTQQQKPSQEQEKPRLECKEIHLHIGETFQLKVIGYDGEVNWSGQGDAAEIDENGLITATAIGREYFYASYSLEDGGNIFDGCTVYVEPVDYATEWVYSKDGNSRSRINAAGKQITEQKYLLNGKEIWGYYDDVYATEFWNLVQEQRLKGTETTVSDAFGNAIGVVNVPPMIHSEELEKLARSRVIEQADGFGAVEFEVAVSGGRTAVEAWEMICYYYTSSLRTLIDSDYVYGACSCFWHDTDDSGDNMYPFLIFELGFYKDKGFHHWYVIGEKDGHKTYECLDQQEIDCNLIYEWDSDLGGYVYVTDEQ